MNKDFVYKHLKKALTGPTSLEDILALFDPRKIAPQEICEALDGLEKDGRIVKTRTDHYGIPEQMNLLTGRVKKLKKGYGFLVTDNMDMEDLFIPPDSLNSAQNGDRVIVRIMKHRSAAGQGGKNRDECEVVRILERHNKMYVGTYKPKAHYAFVVPDNQTFGQDIIVPFDKTYGAADGDKVLVEITYWGGKGEIPEGEITCRSGRCAGNRCALAGLSLRPGAELFARGAARGRSTGSSACGRPAGAPPRFPLLQPCCDHRRRRFQGS